ncbi:MAG: dihydroxyacetone kinase subunit L [Dehalococcoidia bacterium]|nr:dihydroxyacetone kinase subunit L [Dehalococcoidia bacterium]
MDSMDVVIDTVLENEGYFCELDSAAGDGDFGSSLAKGFRGLRSKWESLNKDDIGAFMRSCGMIIMEKCGGASGPIWGTALMQAGRYAKGKKRVDLKELSELFQSMVDGVQKIGGASLGDKTLLDALIPATESLKDSALEHEGMLLALRKSVKAAEDGATSTREIAAKKGRASYLGNRSIGYYDAGAKAIAVILADVLGKCFVEGAVYDSNDNAGF